MALPAGGARQRICRGAGCRRSSLSLRMALRQLAPVQSNKMSFPPIAIQLVLSVLVIVAAVYDARFRRIPNWLVLSGLVLGIGLNGFLFEWSGLRTSFLGLGVAFLVYFPLYLLRGMGAGDV